MSFDIKDVARFGQDAQRQIREQLSKPLPRRPNQQDEFDSKAERDYYNTEIWPRLQTGEIVKCEMHKKFVLLEQSEYDGRKLREIVYTPDFVLTYSDDSVTVVEVKSKRIKKFQREYHIRRRLFIDKYCRPHGWKFKEHFVK